jgi:hypothetical protein
MSAVSLHLLDADIERLGVPYPPIESRTSFDGRTADRRTNTATTATPARSTCMFAMTTAGCLQLGIAWRPKIRPIECSMRFVRTRAVLLIVEHVS